MTPPDTRETPYPRFSERIHADARVTPVMTHCLNCGTPLPDAEITTEGATGGDGMLMFAQCKANGCKRVYVLDYASFR